MVSRQEAIKGIKALIDGYKDSDWYKEIKPPVYNVIKKKVDFRFGCNDGYWDVTRDNKKEKIIEWVNIGSNEWEDWLRNLQAIPVTTKIETDIRVFLGWKIAYKQYSPYLFSVIKKEQPTKIIWYSHSKGCPVTMYAVENVGHYFPEIKQKAIYFSAPRPGNQAFCDAHDKACPDSVMVFINGDFVCAKPLWGSQIANVKGYWRFPPCLPWAHIPCNILDSMEKDTDQKWTERK